LLNPVSKEERRLFLLASILHDVSSAGFGHSVEYIESKVGFDHEKSFEYVVLGEEGESYQYRSATFEPIYFGMQRELRSKVNEEDLKVIGHIIAGKGRFGPLLNAMLDLDNLDNVYRLAYHIGLVKSGEVPLEISRSLWTQDSQQMIKEDAVPLIERWHTVRKKLYLLLLLNPDEFSAKCMLSEAIELAKDKNIHPINWYDTDYEVLTKVSKISSETATIISRLAKGDLYGCIGIFSSARIDRYDMFTSFQTRKALQDELSKLIRNRFKHYHYAKSIMVALHPIKDVNKTERRVEIRTDKGESVQIGQSSRQLLIGVFLKNKDLNIHHVGKLPRELLSGLTTTSMEFLASKLNDSGLVEIKQYTEVHECEQ
jgi:HD superfamily phosphohydrolase